MIRARYYLAAALALLLVDLCWLVPQCNVVRPAYAWKRGSTVPLPAQNVGFRSLNFFDDFTSAATVDTGLTKNAGFKWYLSNAWPGAFNSAAWNNAADTNPASLSVTGGALVKTTAADTVNQGIHTAVANAGNWRGTTFTNGFYVEIKFSVNPYSSGSSGVAWPTYWFMPMEYLVSGAHLFTELDGLEIFSGPQNRLGIADWNMDVGGGGSGSFNSNFVWSGGPSDTGMHTYGKLWQTSTQGGGTGTIRNYYDGVLQSANTVTWTAGAQFSGLDSQHMMMIVDTGVNVTMTIDYVAIYQTSPSDMVQQNFLLRRDLGGPANDNRPVWVDVAA